MTGNALPRLAVVLFGLSASAAHAGDPLVERGRAFARQNCSTCHAIGRQGASPLAEAPAFRILGRRYPVEDLAETFAEGIVTGHPTMPEWRLEADQVAALVAYLQSVQGR